MADLKEIYCLTPIYNEWESFENRDCKIVNVHNKQKKILIVEVNNRTLSENVKTKTVVPTTFIVYKRILDINEL